MHMNSWRHGRHERHITQILSWVLRLMQQKEFNLTSWVAKWKWSSHSKQKWQAFTTNFGCWGNWSCRLLWLDEKVYKFKTKCQHKRAIKCVFTYVDNLTTISGPRMAVNDQEWCKGRNRSCSAFLHLKSLHKWQRKCIPSVTLHRIDWEKKRALHLKAREEVTKELQTTTNFRVQLITRFGNVGITRANR